ncbi:LysR family transcriptional regulator [Psychromarinibacter sp. C21-152]|uniref:LysR family transcriptional regulator n=1 Tax=Psychromarinibacter sediminicola TaxID=3033385 RepID=A0AAE3NTB8_9RHOB|nr:LysR family transcriptional regulator [Psychromarinibacter sediminicola]MDF0601636.1 LysR family transcriptional regulator [Psychromarinibacter sediminicola]
MIEFRHLRYFVAAAEHGSLRKAGMALGIQESTISRAIRDLEDQLGASLFQRHIGGVRLTIAGERFLHRTRTALQQISAGVRDVGAIGRCEDGRVRVGILSSIASGFLSDLLREYNKDHAGIRIDLVDGHPTDHVTAIRHSQLDVAFVVGTKAWTDCESDWLWVERVFAVLPETHSLVGKQELDWSDLVGESFIVGDAAPGPDIHNYLVNRLVDFGNHPEVEVQRVSRDNLLSLVAVGRGLTLTSEATTLAQVPGVTYRPISGEALPFSAIWSARNDNPAMRRLLSMARSMSNAAIS